MVRIVQYAECGKCNENFKAEELGSFEKAVDAAEKCENQPDPKFEYKVGDIVKLGEKGRILWQVDEAKLHHREGYKCVVDSYFKGCPHEPVYHMHRLTRTFSGKYDHTAREDELFRTSGKDLKKLSALEPSL